MVLRTWNEHEAIFNETSLFLELKVSLSVSANLCVAQLILGNQSHRPLMGSQLKLEQNKILYELDPNNLIKYLRGFETELGMSKLVNTQALTSRRNPFVNMIIVMLYYLVV